MKFSREIFTILFLFASSNAIFLNCTFENVQFPPTGSHYFCVVDKIWDLPAGYSGSHLGQRSTADVAGVAFRSNTCNGLSSPPRDLAGIFPNMHGQSFNGCPHIYSIYVDDLYDYPNLKIFDMKHSQISAVPGNLFSATPDIELVNFSNNQIYQVGENLLDHLQHLRRVHFNHNNCINDQANNPNQIPALIEKLRSNCPASTAPTLPPWWPTTLPHETTTPPPDWDQTTTCEQQPTTSPPEYMTTDPTQTVSTASTTLPPWWMTTNYPTTTDYRTSTY